jgi:hypothetical protein
MIYEPVTAPFLVPSSDKKCILLSLDHPKGLISTVSSVAGVDFCGALNLFWLLANLDLYQKGNKPLC